MMAVWLFLHLLGFTLWLGGGLASMVAGLSARREGRAAQGTVARLQTAIQKAVVAPGALLTVLSGLILTFSVTGRGGDLIGFTLALVIMQAAGVLGALIVLLVGLPTAAKLARLDPLGPGAVHFDELRQRQRIVSSIAGTLAVAALVAGAAYRY